MLKIFVWRKLSLIVIFASLNNFGKYLQKFFLFGEMDGVVEILILEKISNSYFFELYTRFNFFLDYQIFDIRDGWKNKLPRGIAEMIIADKMFGWKS